MHTITIDGRTQHNRIPWSKISNDCQIHALHFDPSHLRELLLNANRLYRSRYGGDQHGDRFGDRFELSPKGNHAVLHLQGTQPHFGLLNTWANAKGRPPKNEHVSRRPIDPNDDTPRDQYGRPTPCNPFFKTNS